MEHKCTGCGAAISSSEQLLEIERHIGTVSDSGEVEDRPRGAMVMFTLCFPCAAANLPKIEAAIREALKGVSRP